MINILDPHHFDERTVLSLGYVAEGFLERYGALVDAIDVYVHAGIDSRWCTILVHQDNHALQRRIHREGTYVDVRGAASAALVETLEYN